MSKTKRFETRSPEATITQGFRLETGRFQNEAFWKSHRSKYSYKQDEMKIPIQDRKYGLKRSKLPCLGDFP